MDSDEDDVSIFITQESKKTPDHDGEVDLDVEDLLKTTNDSAIGSVELNGGSDEEKLNFISDEQNYIGNVMGGGYKPVVEDLTEDEE